MVLAYWLWYYGHTNRRHFRAFSILTKCIGVTRLLNNIVQVWTRDSKPFNLQLEEVYVSHRYGYPHKGQSYSTYTHIDQLLAPLPLVRFFNRKNA